MIRILHVIGSMGRGGAEAMIMNLYRHIDRSMIQFDFVENTYEHAAYDDEIVSLGGRIFHCPHYNIVNHFRYVSWWNDFFKHDGQGYRVIHGHLGSTAAIYLSIAKKHGCHAIAHSHSTHYFHDVKDILYYMYSYRTRFIADYFFGCSRQAGISRFGTRVFESKRISSVLNNAIDVDRFAFDDTIRNQVRHEYRIDDDFVVGHVGRMTYPKNPDGIIDIFKAVLRRRPKSKLLWVGDGELRPRIEERIRREGLQDAILLTGARPDVDRLMQAMDAFILPSRYEGLGIVLIEAQAAGLPCFAGDAVPREAGITDLCTFLPLGRPDLWAERICAPLPERRDTSAEIKNAGYDIADTAGWLERFYMDIAKA